MTPNNARTPPRATPMLYSRQRQLLQLLNALGGTAGKLDFQKLLFLYCQGQPSTAPYDFVPYKYGAFSFTSYADCRKLVAHGFIEDDDGWRMTDAGRKVIGHTQDMQLVAFARTHRLRGDELVADTYRRFPFFATRSEIAKRVLKGDDAALARIEAVRTARPKAALFTIGYEGLSVESYLTTLLKSAITILCDVRRNPISRKYGFSKSTLARSCENVGIRYEHLPELGIASEQRKGLDTQADFDALFDDYERTWLPQQDAALSKICMWIDQKERVALTCYENLPHQCHRHCVVDALEVQLGKDVGAKHL